MAPATQGMMDGGDLSGSAPRDRPRARARQAAKRRTFPLINSQIIAVADTGDLELFMSTIEAYLPQMNLVNLSTALHRLAKMMAGTPDAQNAVRQHPSLPDIAMAVRAALAKADAGRAPPQCQALSNVTWSLATIGFVDLPLLQMAAVRACEHFEHFKSFELASILWAYAKLGGLDAAVRGYSTPLFERATVHIQRHADQFTFRCFVMIVWAFATAQECTEGLNQTLVANMQPTLHTATCHELAQVAWSFSSAGVRGEALFGEIAQRSVPRMGEFRMQELADLLWAFAHAGHFHRGLFEGAASAVASADLEPPQVISILWSFSQLRPRHHATRVALLALLPRCARMLAAFQPEGLSVILLVAAKCFGRIGVSSTASVPPVPAQATDFLEAVSPWLRGRLRQLDDMSLAHATVAFLALGGVADGPGAFAALLQEALSRKSTLETQALLLLLWSLCAAEQQCAAAEGAARRLFGEAAPRADKLFEGEAQTLAQICAALMGAEVGAGSLRANCLLLADAGGAKLSGVSMDLCSVAVEDPRRSLLTSTSSMKRQVSSGSSTAPSQGPTPEQASAHGGGGENKADEDARSNEWVCEVKNTFVHINPTSRAGSTEGPALPPPLDIIPTEFAGERLAAYRMDYQRFRAGNALGAKGELCNNMA